MKMRDFLSVERIIPSLRARNKQMLFRSLQRTPLMICL